MQFSELRKLFESSLTLSSAAVTSQHVVEDVATNRVPRARSKNPVATCRTATALAKISRSPVQKIQGSIMTGTKRDRRSPE